MSAPFAGRLSGVADFIRNEKGAISVESVLWLPLYFAFAAAIVDVSMIMNGQARALRVVQDTNRLAASSFVKGESEVEKEVLDRLAHISPNATVDATINADGDEITTTATLPATDLEVLGLFFRFGAIKLTVSSTHLLET